MSTHLVTGGAGFIGSNYILYMFRKYGKEIRIINVDALTYAGNPENLREVEKQDNYTFIKANVCDRAAIEKIFAENEIDRVVHFAAESHVDRSILHPEVFVETNVLGYGAILIKEVITRHIDNSRNVSERHELISKRSMVTLGEVNR